MKLTNRQESVWRMAVTLALLLSTAEGLATPSESATRTVNEYSRAYMRLDVDKVAALSHPILALRAGGAQRYQAILEESFKSYASLGFADGTEIVGTPSDEYVNGTTRMVGFPFIRKTAGTGTIALAYVVISYDGGMTWKVFGLTCTDLPWLKALAPGYSGEPEILGYNNPAAVKAAAGEAFDESLYLQGTSWKRSSSR